MEKENKLETLSNLFEGKEIRSIWDEEKEEYYFSVVDVIYALTDSENPRKYWSVLKLRLKKEGSEVTTNCSQLKMVAPDGKLRNRDAMRTQDILRLIESVPSKKAEPFKLWLTKVGSERIDEIFDPEIATRELTKEKKPHGLEENKKVAKTGGHVAKVARESLEQNLGEKIITSKNSLNYSYDKKKKLGKGKNIKSN